jgi:beta-phosphoglucomutase-like phosphatase (HAD superfamily)
VKKNPQDTDRLFALVIFDCDGVLVDSEVISSRAHAATLTRHGYPITAGQVIDRFLGVSDREARLIVEDEIGRKLPHDFEAQLRQAEMQFHADGLAAIPHVAGAIAAIDLPVCVASSGTPEKIRHGLTRAGLYDRLVPHIFSASEVSRGKPAPDLFLFAAQKMKNAIRTMPRHRRQRPWHHRRRRSRDDRVRLSRRQPLPGGHRGEAAGRRSRRNL